MKTEEKKVNKLINKHKIEDKKMFSSLKDPKAKKKMQKHLKHS